MLRSCKKILVVSGDPKSVFLEIFFKSNKYFSQKPIIIIVNKNILKQQMQMLGFNFKLNEIKNENINDAKLGSKIINFINIPLKKRDVKSYIEKCFKISLRILNNYKDISLINGPINKENFLKGKYPGITEYLGKKTNKLKEVAMLIYNKKLSVCPITTHLPLKIVSKNINKKKIINNAYQINNFYIRNLKKTPNIAITGLNPHCESNFKDSEEKRIIIPAIKFLKKKKIKISGPFPADTIFLEKNYKKFDVIIGMYHDQVLSPIKSMFGFDAINITLGLPFIRISPDHGPNVKMFGKNVSSAKSLKAAFKFLNKK